MKTLLLSLSFVLFTLFTQSQTDQNVNYLIWNPEFLINNYMPFDYYSSINRRNELIKENKVNTIKAFKVKKDGTREIANEKSYNSDGLPIKEVHRNYTVTYSYNGLLLTDVSRKTKKNLSVTHADYDSEGRITHITKRENGKLQSEYRYEYYEKHKTSFVEQITYGRKTYVSRYITEYDDLLKKATRSRFFINGKLEKSWIYSCDEKGVMQKKNVDEVTSCSYNQQNNDGSYIEYTRKIQDGKIYLHEDTYSKDSTLLDSKVFYNEKILVYHFSSDGMTSISENFSLRGKRTYKYSYTSDANGNRIAWKSYSKKDKAKYGYDCTFSHQNLIQKVTYLSNKYSYDFEYTYF